jgi:hypothetical protein
MLIAIANRHYPLLNTLETKRPEPVYQYIQYVNLFLSFQIHKARLIQGLMTTVYAMMSIFEPGKRPHNLSS